MNKPVAYWDGKHFASKDKSSLADIPVYTHERPHNTVLVPCDKLAEMQAEIEALKKFNKAILKKGGCDGNICQKHSKHTELTDEEIIDIWFEVAETNSIAERQIQFAKAILRKAQEK